MPRMANAVAVARAAAAHAAAKKTPENDGVVAVLGPTNTGKTTYAVERMLAHRTGVIGFPLRLLAREVYDRVVALRGERQVALITGEEKIFPPDARYILATVEAMPLDWGADFLAIDEIQLCADPERGHVFTDRLLNARGRLETLFLGAATMWDRIAALAPGARFISRERFSTLSYAGEKKISRLPARSAVVAFSVDNVYAIAELLRRQKGGAAVVMGALSPRTRNAQVALYQEGDVDYLVATDAIGMGLNMDVRHVAFAGLSKFDGRRIRRLSPAELAQIAGRAGRHKNDGTFGVTGGAAPLDPETIEAIEDHKFPAVGRLSWRSAALSFASPQALIGSLEAEPNSEELARAREADDVLALKRLAHDPMVADRARGPAYVRRLWDVCQTPDFQKTLQTEHAALLLKLFDFLTSDAGVVPESWMAQSVARVDRTDGDIDALSKRLAYVRTWTYVANRADWLADPAHWRGVTREIEESVSDALHERLTQRFVDRRTSVLARRLKAKEKLVATISSDGSVSVEGEFVGRLQGFRFEPDPTAAGAEVKTLQAASAQALAHELARRVEKFYNSPDGEIDVTEQGGLMWGDSAVGRVESRANDGGGADPLAIRAIAFADDMIDAPLREKIERRLQIWIDRKLAAAFEPLIALRDDPEVTGLARGVAFQLLERYGVIPRQEIAADVRALEQADRALLRKHGVRFGQYTIFLPALLKPAPTRFRLLLWALSSGMDEAPSPPPPGHVTIPTEEGVAARFYAMAGYRACGPRAIRLDMLERLADLIRPLDVKEGFEASPEMLSITGSTLEQFAVMMEALGYRAEKGERPKTIKPQAAKLETRRRRKDKKAAGDGAAAEAAALAGGGSAGAEGVAPSAPMLVFSAPAVDPEAAADGAQEAKQDAEPQADPDVAQGEGEPLAAAAEPATPDMAPAEQETAPPTPAEPAEAPKPAEGDVASAETPQSSDAAPTTESGPTETAPDQSEPTEAEATETEPAAADASGEGGAADKPVEMEVFYIFRQLPRARRARGEERGPRRRREGEGEEAGGGRRRGPRDGEAEGADGGRRRDRGGKPGGSPRDRFDGDGKDGGPRRSGPKNPGSKGPGGKSGGPHKGGGKPPRRDQPADPDSPFAVLEQLKRKL